MPWFTCVPMVLVCASCSSLTVYPEPKEEKTSPQETLVEFVVDTAGDEAEVINLTGKGSMLVRASYGLGNEISPINDLVRGQVLGQTEEEITDLDPGPLPFVLGDSGKTTLDGQQLYHIAANDDYTFGAGQVDVIADAPAAWTHVTLEFAPQYVCEYVMCEYDDNLSEIPDTCAEPSVVDVPQWIYLQPDGLLFGSRSNAFAGQGNGDDSWTLRKGVLTYAGDNPSLIATSLEFDPSDQSFSYILSQAGIELALKVSCTLQD